MITFDPGKDQVNRRKHGLTLAIAQEVLAGETLTTEDTRESYGETRYQTLGLWRGRVVYVVHTERDGADHIISVRKAEAHEERYYRSQYPR